MIKKRFLKRETESLLKATQNNAIRTNYVKTKIDKLQQNSKCRSCSDKMKVSIIQLTNAANQGKVSLKLDAKECGRLSNENFDKN